MSRQSRLAGRLAGLLAAATLAAAPPSLAQTDEADLHWAQKDDADVSAARAKARETLPLFWEKFDEKPPGYSEFLLKVALPMRRGGEEHIWMDVAGHTDKEVSGSLINDPLDLEGLKRGSPVRVSTELISDWSYTKDERLYGNFTTRVFIARAVAANRPPPDIPLSEAPLEEGAR